MKNFRLNVGQHAEAVAKSIDQFENETLKKVASNVLGSGQGESAQLPSPTVAARPQWMKGHADIIYA